MEKFNLFIYCFSKQCRPLSQNGTECNTVKTTVKNYHFMVVLRNGIRNFILSPTVYCRSVTHAYSYEPHLLIPAPPTPARPTHSNQPPSFPHLPCLANS